jgi:short-subunit dehydrogenase
LELGRRGYRVFALARSEHDLRDLVQASQGSQQRIVPIVMDITDEESREQGIASIKEATGGYGVDVLVNNAGYGQLGPMEVITIEQLRRQFEVNLFGLHAFSQPFIANMRERKRGWIVNMSSAAGRISTPFMGAYSSSKHALEAMSDALRLELAPFGVHVVLIEPGPIPTEFGNVAEESQCVDPSSPYAEFMKRQMAARAGSNLFARSADTVARVVARAIQSDHPRARYTVTFSAKLATVGRRFVPDVLMDWFFRTAMGLWRS